MADIKIPLEVYPIPMPSQKRVVFPRKCVVCGDPPEAIDSVETGRKIETSFSYALDYKHTRVVTVKGFLENLRLDFPLCDRHKNHKEDCRRKLRPLIVKSVALAITPTLLFIGSLLFLMDTIERVLPSEISGIPFLALAVLTVAGMLSGLALPIIARITDRRKVKRGEPPVYYPAYGYSTNSYEIVVAPKPVVTYYCTIYVANEEIAKEITWGTQEVSTTSQPRQLQAIESEPETAQADLNELCDELLLLLTDYLKREPKTLKRIREIGEQLNQEGGFELMQRVGRMVQARDPLKVSWLNNAWDGIGDWRS